MNARIERTDASRTRALRQESLRLGRPAGSTVYPGDDDPRTAHFALCLLSGDEQPPNHDSGEAGELVAVGTVLADPPPWDPHRSDAWRIRGMATKAGCRGRGYGRVVLDALIEYAWSGGGELIWCHARVGALAFYDRAGFTAIGDVFDDGIAIHQSMWRTLPRERSSRLPPPGISRAPRGPA